MDQNYSVSLASHRGAGDEEVAVAAPGRARLTYCRTGSFTSIPFNGCQKRKQLKKQLSMRETRREAMWEKRRRQMIQRRLEVVPEPVSGEAVINKEGEEERSMGDTERLTDEDLDELRGCIELGFGFCEEEGGRDLRRTVRALGLYFAVNRQLLDLKLESPVSNTYGASSPTAVCASTRSPAGRTTSISSESWKICRPGEDSKQVKARLKHWAQVVACSVKQSC